MIVRMWHGRVPTEKAAAYRAFLNARAIPDYQSVPGNLGVYILERQEGDVTHFITLTYWESMDALRKYTESEAFRKAHENPPPREWFAGHPVIEVYNTIKEI